MTRFEREDWNVIGAPGLRVFDTPWTHWRADLL